MKKVFLLTISILFVCFGNSQEVYESKLTENSVLVQLSSDQVKKAKNDRSYAFSLGTNVAWKMVKLAGIPESATGKVAGVAVWGTLTAKYGNDIYKYSRRNGKNQNLTLKYRGVNLDGVRAVWKASEVGDEIMPGGKLSNKIVDTCNKLLNMYLD